MTHTTHSTRTLAAILLLAAGGAHASDVADAAVKTFTANETLKAGELNQNFSALKQGVNSKQDKLTGSCAAGSFVRQVNADGSLVCDVGTGPAGPQGPIGPVGPQGATGPADG
jgi:hypothetical protein